MSFQSILVRLVKDFKHSRGGGDLPVIGMFR